ncbi:hypothetical protein AMAG_01630 [Allomyces macrogynus ATCC 38327]|uniref:Uncharacterized protein n=1 Tax=Allomyces macrogynus (strain ATCC 38327) TaxID=578462 RepID=A0A0L0RZI7_ALLM3|nr:hypothetical protein AMAG_01630 [Allomyces macrogynus ATCC 38327]|eukprot:KNE55753.1 hypothetical protein AMAG_01630 [Allomyces macrogynus ATCC 38327]
MGCGASKATQQSAVGPEEKTGTGPPAKNGVKPDAEPVTEAAIDDAALPTSTFEGYKNYKISASGRDLGPARPLAAPQQTSVAVTSPSASSTTKFAAVPTPTPTPAPAPTPVQPATDDVVPATIPLLPRPSTTSPRPWSANVRQSASRIDPARVPLPSSADISARAAIRTPLPASADVVARTAVKTPLPPSMYSLAAVDSEANVPHDADRVAVRAALPPSTYSIAATAPRPASADVARSNGKIAQNDVDTVEPVVRPRPATAEVARSAVKTPLPPSTYSLAIEASVLAAVEDAAPDVPLPASTDQLRFPD